MWPKHRLGRMLPSETDEVSAGMIPDAALVRRAWENQGQPLAWPRQEPEDHLSCILWPPKALRELSPVSPLRPRMSTALWGDVTWDEADPTLLPGGSQARGLIAPLPES
jgi:hypothetical protein